MFGTKNYKFETERHNRLWYWNKGANCEAMKYSVLSRDYPFWYTGARAGPCHCGAEEEPDCFEETLVLPIRLPGQSNFGWLVSESCSSSDEEERILPIRNRAYIGLPTDVSSRPSVCQPDSLRSAVAHINTLSSREDVVIENLHVRFDRLEGNLLSEQGEEFGVLMKALDPRVQGIRLTLDREHTSFGDAGTFLRHILPFINTRSAFEFFTGITWAANEPWAYDEVSCEFELSFDKRSRLISLIRIRINIYGPHPEDEARLASDQYWLRDEMQQLGRTVAGIIDHRCCINLTVEVKPGSEAEKVRFVNERTEDFREALYAQWPAQKQGPTAPGWRMLPAVKEGK